MAICGVYVITNLTNGKSYVGSSVNVRRRWDNHRRDLMAGRHPNRHLQAAWRKYGSLFFTFTVVECVDDRGELRQAEQMWIDAIGSCGEGGYNLTPTAGSLLGFRFTDEQKARVSAALIGKPKSTAHRANIWRNREVTDEFRAHCAELGRMGAGKPKSAEHRAKIGSAQRGSKNHLAKLTEQNVRDLRARLANGERGRALAAEFGISEATVSEIKHGKKWQHVTR